ncbi:MAG: FMN-binding protein [Clostridia bacterium]|nr:FMN-binding protein [Clostridia bacterium]
MKKAILIPTISLFIICLCATFLLGLVNDITKDKIAQNAVETEMNSRKVVMADAEDFGEKVEGNHIFEGVESPYNYVEAYDKDGKLIGYVFVTQSTGYGGAISTMTGVDTQGKVTGVEFLQINETVGLGMNATKDSFKDQFKGLSGVIGVNKNESTETEVKALTGATITSKAAAKGVNIALDVFESISGGENNG